MTNNNVVTAPEFPTVRACTICHMNLRGQRVPVRLHPYLLIFWALSVLSGIMYGPVYIAFRFVIDVLGLFATVFVHECGHAAAAIGYGGKAHSITLWPLGGFAEISHEKGPKEDLWVCFAGPLTHIPMCLIWYGILAAAAHGVFSISGIPCDIRSSGHCFWTNVCAQMGILNIMLFCFNLFLPAYPLDASRILLNFLGMCKVPVNRAAMIVCAVSLPLGLGLIIYGIYGWLHGSAMYSMTLFIGIFSLFATWGVFKAARNGSASRHPAFYHYERESEPSGPSTSYTSFPATLSSAFPAPGLPSTRQAPAEKGHVLGGTVQKVPPYQTRPQQNQGGKK